MSFKPELVEEFLAVFRVAQPQIAAFEGCHKVELFQDVHAPNVKFTYSIWDSDEHLQAYRNSQLFEETWAKTKVLFNDKPLAYSLEEAAF